MMGKKITCLHKLIDKISKAVKKEDIAAIVKIEEKYNKIIRKENQALIDKQVAEAEEREKLR
jgi:hypothetical protein